MSDQELSLLASGILAMQRADEIAPILRASKLSLDHPLVRDLRWAAEDFVPESIHDLDANEFRWPEMHRRIVSCLARYLATSQPVVAGDFLLDGRCHLPERLVPICERMSTLDERLVFRNAECAATGLQAIEEVGFRPWRVRILTSSGEYDGSLQLNADDLSAEFLDWLQDIKTHAAPQWTRTMPSWQFEFDLHEQWSIRLSSAFSKAGVEG